VLELPCWLLLNDNQLGRRGRSCLPRAQTLSGPRQRILGLRFSSSSRQYISIPRAREGRPFNISRQPSKSHPPSTGTINYFGSITPWRGCFPMKTSSTMHNLTSNKPSRTQSTTHTAWVARWTSKLGFGIDKAGSKRQKPRLCAHSRPLRSLGLQAT
jgi:hypothetical protein